MNRHVIIASALGVMAKRIEQFLSERGYRVDVVQSGVECLEKIQRMPPDALILDWDLPWGGGTGVLASLRAADVTANLPVILIAGRFARDVDLDPPVVWCLPRPLDVEMLYDAVDSELDSFDSASGNSVTRQPQIQVPSVCR